MESFNNRISEVEEGISEQEDTTCKNAQTESWKRKAKKNM